ncbi:hypothetical protein NE237_027317 [Protea cynaroides]|uniref:Uncharacterized protein n=1 Tax=Protea cynaroides TaxID=273540 RepID=A0A9Q0GQ93_9MAGN|nr:hypothetical protein NE237_027317 [Protea cynaroides]
MGQMPANKPKEVSLEKEVEGEILAENVHAAGKASRATEGWVSDLDYVTTFTCRAGNANQAPPIEDEVTSNNFRMPLKDCPPDSLALPLINSFELVDGVLERCQTETHALSMPDVFASTSHLKSPAYDPTIGSPLGTQPSGQSPSSYDINLRPFVSYKQHCRGKKLSLSDRSQAFQCLVVRFKMWKKWGSLPSVLV